MNPPTAGSPISSPPSQPGLLFALTLPLLLFGLYAGLLVLSLGLTSWVTHDHPAEPAARRVTDAAERAALSQLATPAKHAGATILLITTFASAHASVNEGPALWYALASISVPLLIGAAVYFSARKLVRTSGQLVDLSGSDSRVALTSRSVLAAVLCCEAAVGLVILGLHTLAGQELSSSASLTVVMIGTFSASVAAVVFARSSSAILLSTAKADREALSPNPASLAILVAESFHGPLVRLLTLIVISAFGHLALLTSVGKDATADSLWLFPHLLKLLGLFALVFAGFVVRNNEEETSAGWTRGALVFLVLMIAGAWALSSELPDTWARSVPSGLTFFFLLLGATAWAAPAPTAQQNAGLLIGVASRFGSLGAFITLLLTLLIATSLAPEEVALPEGALVRLVMAGSLAAAPLALSWFLASELGHGSGRCAELAYAGQRGPIRFSVTPSSGLLGLFPLLCFTASVAATSGALLEQTTVSGRLLLLLCLGVMLGGSILVALLGSLERTSLAAGDRVASLIREHHAKVDPTGHMNFELVVDAVRRSSANGVPVWMALIASSALLILGLRFVLPAPLFQSLGFGLTVGVAAAGSLIAWSLHDSGSEVKRTFGRLALVSSVVQATWLFASTLVQS